MFLLKRRTELLLILASPAFLAGGLYSLELSDATARATDMQMVLVFAGMLLAAHFYLALSRPTADELLLPVVGMLSAFGLVYVRRLEPDLARTQLLWLGLGIVTMLAVLTILPNPNRLRNYKYLAATTGVALLIVTALFGKEINGARLWLSVAGYTIQSTELLKVLLVIFLAGYLADKHELLSRVSVRWAGLRLPSLPYLVPIAIIWALTLIMLIWQKDLGAVAILMAVTLTMLYVATGRISFVITGALLLFVNIYLTYHTFGYVRSRVDVWLNPWDDSRGSGYQIIQALYALGNGRLFGTGPGHGFPEYIPAVHTDFVFAAIGEEFGFIGAGALLALYLVLAFRGLRTSAGQTTGFARLLALGGTATLSIQTLVIIAGNLALIPVTGVTVPFVSYGGSSLLVNFIIIGLLLQMSTAPGRRTAIEPARPR